MSLKSGLHKIKDNADAVLKSMRELEWLAVLVGVPDDGERATQDGKNARAETQAINNAALAMIHNDGSPARNIPARPFMAPGIAAARSDIVRCFRDAAKAALGGNPGAVRKNYTAAGLISQAAIRAKITDGPFVPLQPGTVKARRYARGTASTRKSEQKYMELVAAGIDPGVAQDAAGIKPLINTGQLRNAITYVLREKK